MKTLAMRYLTWQPLVEWAQRREDHYAERLADGGWITVTVPKRKRGGTRRSLPFGTVWVTAGITRSVLLIGRWAIKVPHFRYGFNWFLKGLLCNYSEWTWSGWQSDDHPDMVQPNPVIFRLPGGLLNVYRRADSWMPPPGLTEDELTEHMQTMAGFFGDAKIDNFGTIDNRIVLLDYDMHTTSCWNCDAPPDQL